MSETGSHPETIALLGASLAAQAFRTQQFRDNLRIYVKKPHLIDALRLLKEKAGFGLLSELGGTDYLKYPGHCGTSERFEVHYVLRNLDANRFLVVKVGVSEDDPTVAS